MAEPTINSGVEGKVYFHPEQMKYLEEVFGRVVLPPTSTQAEMNHYFGQQSVLQFMRLRVRR